MPSNNENSIERPEIKKPSVWERIKSKLGYIVSGTLLIGGLAVLVFVPVAGATAILIHDLALIPIALGGAGTVISGANDIKDRKKLKEYYATMKEIEIAKEDGCCKQRGRILKLYKKLLRCKLKAGNKIKELKLHLASDMWIDEFEQPIDKTKKKFSKITTLHQLDRIQAGIKNRNIKGRLRPYPPFIGRNQKKTARLYERMRSDESRQDIVYGSNTPSAERRLEVVKGIPIIDPRTGVKTQNQEFIKKFEEIQKRYKGTINTSPYTHIISVEEIGEGGVSYQFKSNSETILKKAAEALCDMVEDDKEFIIVESETKHKGRTGETLVNGVKGLKEYFGIRIEAEEEEEATADEEVVEGEERAN